MSIGKVLYLLFIYPIQLVLEIVFTTVNYHVSNPGYAIICLSLVVNILVLPLYINADRIQKEQNEIDKKIAPGIAHIKKAFTGDERFMMLQMYYKANNYSPIMSLRSATSLLLQIPFFMAAYRLLSSINSLNGVSFWFINDLGSSDKLFHIGSFPINILPILMTLFNFASSYVYTKNLSLKDKIQTNATALVFLVLLYNAPAGLAFYWLLNNAFSLVKNIVVSLFTFFGFSGKKARLFLEKIISKIPDSNKDSTILFVLSGIYMSLLIGFYIPLFTISLSPLELMDPVKLDNPIKYAWISLATALGVFVVWGFIIYSFSNKKLKTVVMYFYIFIAMIVTANYFYVVDLQNLWNKLVNNYSDIRIFILIVSIIGIYLVCRYSKLLVKTLLAMGIIGLIVLSVDIVPIANNIYNRFDSERTQSELQINLSSEGENVIVIMLDRDCSFFFPYLLEMNPEFVQQFDGFTFYPNTLSFGGHTNIATPALFGGYEYTPDKINQRSDESLESKQNEALTVMPLMFSQEGFDVTVVNPPYAGYSLIPDLSIYDEYPSIKAYNTGSLFNPMTETTNADLISIRERDMFLYGICTVLPGPIGDFLFDRGNYINPYTTFKIDTNIETDVGLAGFVYSGYDEYCTLKALPGVTVVNNDSNSFVMFTSELTHENVNGIEEYIDIGDDWGVIDSYISQLATNELEVGRHIRNEYIAISLLGDWFDYLRELGVYDNSKIIIVSDHGYPTFFLPDMVANNGEPIDFFNPLLLYKDFGEQGFTVSEEFMTNADTPYLATYNVLSNPVNPFTGNVISTDFKNSSVIRICNSHLYNTNIENGNVIVSDMGYYEVTITDDLFSSENWVAVDN